MAITVKDIREKEFKQINMGYKPDEVDDFLDEIADHLEKTYRNMRSMQKNIEDLNVQLDDARAQAEKAAEAPEAPKAEPAMEVATVSNAPAVAQSAPIPAFNEPSYFKNLETTLRETLISAQRIADETIDDARKKARKIVAEAEEQSSVIQEQSAAKMAEAKADYDQIKNATEEYRRNFSQLIEGQTKLIKENPLFS